MQATFSTLLLHYQSLQGPTGLFSVPWMYHKLLTFVPWFTALTPFQDKFSEPFIFSFNKCVPNKFLIATHAHTHMHTANKNDYRHASVQYKHTELNQCDTNSTPYESGTHREHKGRGTWVWRRVRHTRKASDHSRAPCSCILLLVWFLLNTQDSFLKCKLNIALSHLFKTIPNQPPPRVKNCQTGMGFQHVSPRLSLQKSTHAMHSPTPRLLTELPLIVPFLALPRMYQ